jgi:hypothetical protein
VKRYIPIHCKYHIGCSVATNNGCCATSAVEAAFLPNDVVERVTLRKRKDVAISL